MGELTTETIEIFHLSQNGCEVAFGRSELEVRAHIKNEKSGYEITSSEHQIATADGTVYDWSIRGGHSFNLKLHWNCPKCGVQHWGDFVSDVANPYFTTSDTCNCVGYWLIRWEPLQAAAEKLRAAAFKATEGT
jgi:hypothetical protein